MPIYEFKCPCGERSEELLPMDKRDSEMLCVCGKVKERQISRTSLVGFDNLGRSKSNGE